MRSYIDTSVFIARHTQSRKQAEKIETATGSASGRTKVSGLAVRQELKRRLLGDAEYLYRQLDIKNGYAETVHHLNRNRENQYQKNRAGICLGLMASITGVDDEDKTDRLKTKLRTLIVTCLSKFDCWIDHLERGSGCRCATIDPVEQKRGGRVTFEMGENKCGGVCAVNRFLVAMSVPMGAIRNHLTTIIETTERKQLREILTFL